MHIQCNPNFKNHSRKSLMWLFKCCPEHFYFAKRKPIPLWVSSHIAFNLHQWKALLNFQSHQICLSWIFWVCGILLHITLFCPVPFTYDVFQIHSWLTGSLQIPSSWITFHRMDINDFLFIHSSVDWHFSCVYLLGTGDNATMNIQTHGLA